MKHVAGSWCVLWTTLITIGCGAGLPPEERSNASTGGSSGNTQTSTSCALTGDSLDFNVTNTTGSFLFWVADAQNFDIRVDEAKAKLLFDVPEDQLPQGIDSAQVRVAPEPDANLPANQHVDTAFRISAIIPQDMTGFAGGAQTPLTLTLRYDPVTCKIQPDIEANLVLGRLNSFGQWLEVCGDHPPVGGHEVSCATGDLSFGVFGVIGQGALLNDTTPPFFPTTAQTLSLVTLCLEGSCGGPHIDFQWGAASDGSGSGVKGYRLYVDGFPTAFVANVTGNPIQYSFIPTGSLDIRSTHKYQITAVDAADNESALYGALLLP